MGALKNVVARIKALVTADNKQFKKTMKDTTQTAKKTGSAFNKLGAMISGALVVAGIVKFGKAMLKIGKSMDLMNIKATAVFGQYKKDVMGMAEDTASSMGMTKTEFVNTAAGIQDLLIPIGFARKEATGMTKDMMGLAGALSTWTGGTISATEVGNIFAKAMLGEREQLKTLGISLSEAEIKTELLATGQSKLTGEALAQAKAQITLALITAKSTDAQEAFGEAQDSLVVNSAIVGANIRSIGENIAIIMDPAMRRGAEAAKGLTGQIKELTAAAAEVTGTDIGFFDKMRFSLAKATGGFAAMNIQQGILNKHNAITRSQIETTTNAIFQQGGTLEDVAAAFEAYGTKTIGTAKAIFRNQQELARKNAAEVAAAEADRVAKLQEQWDKELKAFREHQKQMGIATQAFQDGLRLTTSAAELAAMETTKLGVATHEAGAVMDTIPEKGALAGMGIGMMGQSAEQSAKSLQNAKNAVLEATFVGQAMGDVMNEVMWSIVDAAGAAGASFGDIARAAGNAAKKTIAAEIAVGVASAVKGALVGTPFPLSLILAPLAGAAASALFSSIIPSFGYGGMTNGPTLAMVGDNPSGKEMIIPSEMFGQMGGGAVEVYGRLRGDTMLIQNRRTQDKLKRTGRM